MDTSMIRKKARNALSGKWGIAVIGGLIASIFLTNRSNLTTLRSNLKNIDYENINASYLINDVFFGALGFIFYIGILVGLAFFIIRGAIRIGYCQFNMDIIDNREPQLGTIFSRFNIFGKAFVLELLTSIFVFLWTLLFIIPGIIASLSYAMAPYIMADNPDITASDAISKSSEMMYGYKLDLFILHLSFIGWGILCLFTCGIGYLWLYPYMRASEAAFYTELRGEKEI